MFGHTLLNKFQKENSVTGSQNFMPGMMSRFIGDGSEKHDLPLAPNKDNRFGAGGLGSPTPAGIPGSSMHQKKGSNASFRSGNAHGTKESTSENGSNV